MQYFAKRCGATEVVVEPKLVTMHLRGIGSELAVHEFRSGKALFRG